MTNREKLKRLQELAESKATFMDKGLKEVLEKLSSLGNKLFDEIAGKILASLDFQDGQVVMNVDNLNKLQKITSVVDEFIRQHSVRIVAQFVGDASKIVKKNAEYFNEFMPNELTHKEVKTVVYNRLGLKEDGTLKTKGYMKGVLDADIVKKRITDYMTKQLKTRQGFEDMRKGLKAEIAGDAQKAGAFSQFYRAAAYDVYTKVDRIASKAYADKLNLRYFVYAGTRRAHSRYFCLQRKGKVFSTEEAQQWKYLIGTMTVVDGKQVPAGPIMNEQDAPGYDPYTDCGGYNCVDDVMWISEELAKVKRPDLF